MKTKWFHEWGWFYRPVAWAGLVGADSNRGFLPAGVHRDRSPLAFRF